MRTNLVTNLLVGLVVVSVISTAVLAVSYVRSVRKLNTLQLQNAIINRNRTLANSLASEVVEYSKTNPAIDPLLQSVNIKPKSGASPKP